MTKRLKVYKVYNDFDHKVYVGQTVLPLEVRFKQHCTGAGALHLHRAILKYGKEHFFIEELDEASSAQDLNEREVAWIKRLDSVKNGYNMVYSAHGGPEKAQMRWDRMTKEERQAANAYIKDINAKRWAEATEEDRKATGQAMKNGWTGKDRSSVIKAHWSQLTDEQKKQRSDAMKAGWAKRLGK